MHWLMPAINYLKTEQKNCILLDFPLSFTQEFSANRPSDLTTSISDSKCLTKFDFDF